MKLVFCATAIISFLASANASSDQTVAGIIEQIQCRAELTQRSGHSPVRLDPKRDIGRSLFPGESVLCTSTGSMELLVFGRAVKINRPGVPYPIPYVRPSHLNDEEQMRQSALEDYSRRGGRERSATSPREILFTTILLHCATCEPRGIDLGQHTEQGRRGDLARQRDQFHWPPRIDCRT